MRKAVLLYGLLGGALIALLKVVEFRYLVVEHSIEIYGGLVALIFVTLGLWLGNRLTTPKTPAVFTPKEEIGMTKRELEILQLLAAGLSNREIAEQIFVTENTVKTHLSHVFQKLGARRRTQAVQMGKELGLIP